MAKRFYQVGEPCDVCGTPCIASKNPKPGGSIAYCWPCWSKWKDAKNAPQTQQTPQMTQTPTPTQNAPQNANSGSTERIIELLESIDAKLEEIRYNSLKDETTGEKIPF